MEGLVKKILAAPQGFELEAHSRRERSGSRVPKSRAAIVAKDSKPLTNPERRLRGITQGQW